MPATFPEIVRANLIALGARPGDRFLIALSGGGDSTALALAMCETAKMDTLTAAHLDHAVRKRSGEDRKKVEELCRKMGLPVLSNRLDHADIDIERKKHGSLEGALRNLRYLYLEQAAEEVEADWILTAHTWSDQAETVLFRVGRRMDWRSLEGIPEKNGRILRPMLTVTGAWAREYCRSKGIEPLEDPSNLHTGFARNRIRHVTIPALEQNFHPDVTGILNRTRQAARSLVIAETGLVGPVFTSEGDNKGTVMMELARFTGLPVSLQTGAVVLLLDTVLTGRRPSGALVSDIVRFLGSGASGQIVLPEEMVLAVTDGQVRIHVPESLSSPLPDNAVPLSVPGRVDLPNAGFAIVAEEGMYSGSLDDRPSGAVYLSKEKLGASLWIRRRRQGDRFMPLGMKMEKKLKKFLIDRKVPRLDRDSVPLILDEKGRIVWVAGIEISQHAALEMVPGEKMVILRIENRK
jgi:tRNA(Ile)-lysidine synthase